MFKKIISLALVLALLAAAPAALASEYYSARTPLAGSGSAKLNNVALAVEAINGTYIPTGEAFSFNETVGPRTKDRGFQTAPNGRGAQVTGGGVAQAASTLYLALLAVREPIEIDPVQTYGSRFTDSYVTDASFAVVTDYDAGIDLSFTNNAEPITIDMWMNDNYVYCSITVGEDDDAATATNAGDWFIAPASPTPVPAQSAQPRRLVGSASLACGDSEGVQYNVKLAADSVTDTALNSGDTFSFNEIVGPRTEEFGYVEAVNGRGAKVIGGGVAQVASALWLAVKDSGEFAVVEKSTYGSKYNQDYVESSADAILTDYASGRDFSFRYTGAGSVTIYTYVADGLLYCDIYQN